MVIDGERCPVLKRSIEELSVLKMKLLGLVPKWLDVTACSFLAFIFDSFCS